jgi:hypothetical protein
MQRRNVVLEIFILLTIAFASLSTFEYSKLGTQKTATVTSTEVVQSQQTIIFTITQVQRGTATWDVLKENMTVSPDTACVVITAFGFGCPTEGNATASPYVHDVELLSYQGNQYYMANQTVNTIPYTIWFTNSTVFCISPAFDEGPISYLLCP